MLDSLTKAFGQLSDPPIKRLLANVLFGILGAFALLWVVVWLAVEQALPALGLADWILGAVGGLAILFITWVLFPAVALVVSTVFLETVARAVEARHYPGLPGPRAQPWAEILWMAVRFMVVTVVLNLLALPAYLLLPGLNIVIFYLINGYLLGREYFELVALRRVDEAAVRRLRRRFGARLYVGGIVVAFLLSVPVLNLLAPVVATAFMVHVFHRLRPEPLVV